MRRSVGEGIGIERGIFHSTTEPAIVMGHGFSRVGRMRTDFACRLAERV